MLQTSARSPMGIRGRYRYCSRTIFSSYCPYPFRNGVKRLSPRDLPPLALATIAYTAQRVQRPVHMLPCSNGCICSLYAECATRARVVRIPRDTHDATVFEVDQRTASN